MPRGRPARRRIVHALPPAASGFHLVADIAIAIGERTAAGRSAQRSGADTDSRNGTRVVCARFGH